MNLPPSRELLPAWCAARGLMGAAVEVGCWTGRYTATWCKDWPGIVHTVDPWRHQPKWTDILNRPQPEMDAAYDEACFYLAPYTSTGKCVIHKTTSAEAAEHLWAEQVDVVYLDARHDFDSVTLDLLSWYPRVIPGGVISGHDYLDTTQGNTIFGVKSAVDRFFAEQGYAPSDIGVIRDGAYPSWVVVKR